MAIDVTDLWGHVVRQAAAGDPRAFRRLYDREVGTVRRFARALVHDQSLADEITQETFVRAHSRLSSLDDTARVVPWLLGIARLVSFEQLRARGQLASLDDLALEESPTSAPGPEAIAMGAEADQAFARALDDVPTERRAALLLAIDHGLAYADIASAMGWTLAKTKIEIHRARASLRARLTEYVGGVP